MKKPIKYEVNVLLLDNEIQQEVIEDAQNKGWEIAGNITVKENGLFYVPMKRQIK